jgi:hypothetical protein
MNEEATSDDFVPRDVPKRPSQPPIRTIEAEGGRVVESARVTQNHYRSRVEMSEIGKVDLQQFWFPGWQATVDRVPVKTAPSGPQTVVSCDVPAGEHIVEFSYSSLPQRRTGVMISIVSAAIGAFVLWFLRQHLYKDIAVRNR